MEDTDNDLSEDLLSESSDPPAPPLVRLPPDYPWWAEAVEVLRDLSQSGTPLAIQENINKLAEITGSEGGEKNSRTVSHFLENVCCEQERQLLCSLIIPTVASLALQINQIKPFIGLETFRPGQSDSRQLHPDFVMSLISHSFLSTTGRRSLNLNLASLDPQHTDTHWKLRSYFNYFHSVFQNPDSRGNLIVLKQVSQASQLSGLASGRKLINFIIADEIPDAGENCLKLTFANFAEGLLTKSSPLNSEFSIKRPELLMPFLLIDELASNESIRATNSSSNLTIVSQPDLERTETSLVQTLETLLAGLSQNCQTESRKSLLRRPSVSAVTSCSSEGENPPDKTGSSNPSLSESCPEQNVSDSELSYNLSARVRAGGGRRNKTKKKESFNERLRAALERGNTPDESDDQSAGPRLAGKPVLPLHRRLIRRQRSSGFKAFNDLEDSEEFFTATEDERSHTPARRLGPLRLAPVVCKRTVASHPTSSLPSAQVSSASTSSSNLEPSSDSESFSSSGLGMPQMEDSCLEDLCDKLHGCLETGGGEGEGGLTFRNIQLRRAVRRLGVRSLSETFLSSISDLDHLGEVRQPSLSSAYSCPGLLSRAGTESRHPGGPETDYGAVCSHSLSEGEGELWQQQLWPFLLWLSASVTPSQHFHSLNFNTAGNTNLSQLLHSSQLVKQADLSVSDLYAIIVEFLENGQDNFFNFLCNKLVSV